MRDVPIGIEATRLLGAHARSGGGGVLHITDGEQRAEAIARFLAAAAPEAEVLVFPPWDCLPYDTASPSPEAMGRRMRVLRRLRARRTAPPLLLTTVEAALQRVPPPQAVDAFELTLGAALDQAALRDFCRRTGYVTDDRVDEPGEIAFRGEVIDIFPAADAIPCRVEIEDGRVAALRLFDPVTQRSVAEAEALVVDAASELPARGEAEEEGAPGAEHWLPEVWDTLATLHDYMPEAVLAEPPGIARIRARTLLQIREAHRDRERGQTPDAAGRRRVLPPDRLYVTEEEWRDAAAGGTVLDLEDWAPVPPFAADARPRGAFLRFLTEQRQQNRRILITAPSEAVLARLKRRARLPEGERLVAVPSLAAAADADPGAASVLTAPLEAGFVDQAAGLAVVAAADLLGSRAGLAEERDTPAALWRVEAAEFHLGDVVVHLDHGAATLMGIEALAEGEAPADAIRLGYSGGHALLAPAGEAGRLWRYASSEAEVSLERLNSDVWTRRRSKIAATLAETARGLVAATQERARRKAPKLAAPQALYERFAERFPFPLTADQRVAVEAALADMASGAPMNRLVVGDVGFGKTEVALRAAAAAALSGAQVAVIAPTTVLARQHYDTFRRRFAGFDVEVAHLSRLVPPKEARRVRAALAEGAVRLVVGTHALFGKGVAFADLGLLVVDEEQRFGARHKQALRRLGESVHVLTMTATPIPRTLQAALVGLQDLSAIGTPPLRRRPIRTLLADYAPAGMRQALLREKRRGGQSFVVVPRVEDVEPMQRVLGDLLPRLELRVAHGQMPARQVDAAMVDFAAGRGDVLLATSIIESGLDVPRANTMVVLRPDLFGLAQLHQLRGRVGRGHLQAYCYLMAEPSAPLPPEAARRLGTLQAFDRLGAGMAISMYDLDMRGGGDLFGERQAGHAKLIGLALYQDLLAAAVRRAKGAPDEPDDVALEVGGSGRIPEDYVPEPIVRINLYHRLARSRDTAEVDALADEIADRFGAPPEPVRDLLAEASIRALARALGVLRISAGPRGIAFAFRPGAAIEDALAEASPCFGGALDWNGERLLCTTPSQTPQERRALALDLLNQLS